MLDMIMSSELRSKYMMFCMVVMVLCVFVWGVCCANQSMDQRFCDHTDVLFYPCDGVFHGGGAAL